MANFIPIDSNLISVRSPSGQNLDIAPAITRLAVSFTMDMCSEINFEVLDPGFKFAKANYFQIRRDITYNNMLFEISAVEVQRSTGYDPLYRISARSKPIQLMKRDKAAEAFTGMTPTQFAAAIAARFSMGFFGQETIKNQTIVKGRSANVDESVWDVVTRVASDNQFVVFETNNILFFTSQTNLAGKWGDPDFIFKGNTLIPFGWPESAQGTFPGAAERYQLIDMPTLRRSDDDPMDAEGSILVERTNGRQLRPGMTINLTGIPDFEGLYLITAVDFEEGVSDPVTVSFRIPSDPEAPAGGGNGGYTSPSDSSALPLGIEAAIQDYVKRFIGIDPNTKPYTEHSNDYNRLVQTALLWAEDIWEQATISGKDARLTQMGVTVEGGTTSVAYLAVKSVMGLLSSNVVQTGQGGVTITIKNALRTELTKLLGISSGRLFSDTYNRALKDAKEIWEATSYQGQTALYNQFARKYGNTSASYIVLTRISNELRKDMPNLLNLNRPPTDR